MPKGTKTLGNSKALAWESRGFVHKKEDVYILTHPLFCFIRNFEWYYCRFLWRKPLFSLRLLRNQHVFLSLVILCVITIRTVGVHRPHHWCWVSARWHDMIKRAIVAHPLWRKNKMYHNCKNTSKILTAKNESASETLFLTFIIISLFFYNERNPQDESSCHSYHKRIAYNLLIWSTFAQNVKSDSKMKLKIL